MPVHELVKMKVNRGNQNGTVSYFAGIRRLERMEKTHEFKSIGARIWDRHHPGCKDYEYRSDDYWRCHIRHNTLNVYHPTSTCKMGSKDDPSTVVDRELRLFE